MPQNGQAKGSAIVRARSAGALPPPPHAARCFRDQDGEVDYADTAASWVAAAPPRATPAERVAVARRFAAAAAAAGRRVTWFGVDARFARALDLTHVRIGSEAWWRADRWQTTLRACRSLRGQLHRAANKAVVVRAIAAEDLHDERLARDVARLLERWSSLHALPPMAFLCAPDPLRAAPGRVVWLAEGPGGLVGCAAIAQLPGAATLVTDLARDPTAPNGTTELLFDAVLQHAQATGHGRVSLGLLPLHGEVPRALRCVRALLRRHYDFAGLARFKQKLRPHGWRDQWLAHERGRNSCSAVLDVARAFAGTSLTRYALRSVRRSAARLRSR